MNLSQLWTRILGRYARTANEHFYKRSLVMKNHVPYISFTFDDFPRSAFHTGGEILRRFGLRATYYVSMGLLDSEAPTGRICILDDIKELVERGHELGCHTFAHYDTLKTNPQVFEESIIKNKKALNERVPGATFLSFSYPISGPRPETKRRVSKYFRCCRGGGQTFNVGTIDLNLLKAFFLEKSRDRPSVIKDVIDQNCQARGWMIFATHDISETPSPYGCTPTFFEDIVKYSLDSGARILPVAEALDAIRVGT